MKNILGGSYVLVACLLGSAIGMVFTTWFDPSQIGVVSLSVAILLGIILGLVGDVQRRRHG